MKLTETKQSDIVIFRIQGRLDSNTSTAFEDKIFSAIKAGAKKVLLDFSDLEYISSAGLRIILKATKDLKRTEGHLVLCAMQDYVKEVFEISGFDTFLPIMPSVGEGIQAFESFIASH